MKKPTTPSRRNFLKNTALATAGLTILPRHVLGGKGYIPPSDTINIALVGAGGRGKQNAQDLMKLEDVRITAMADPAEYWDLSRFYYRNSAGRGPVKEMLVKHYSEKNEKYSLNEYLDFRELLEKEPSLDAILCATPDHTHAYISLAAMRAGKHVYCEKPLTHNIWEAREVAKVAKETGLATQMGNQMHSSIGVRTTVEHLRAGTIGKIKEVHAWVPATRWTPSLTGVPTTKHRKPYGLDWDLWLGPRAMRDYNNTYAPVTWRDYWDFGCGAMGDFGCHDLDALVWGLDLDLPDHVVIHAAGYSDKDIAPYGEIGYFTFPAKGKQPAFKANWYAGGLKPDRPESLPREVELPRRGGLYIGEKGIMLYSGGREAPKIFQKGKLDPIPAKRTLAPTNGHHRDWVDAIKGGPQASSNFAYGAHLTEITLLGVLSLRLNGQTIYWDGENMKAKGIGEADPFIKEPVRKGWEM